MRSILINITFVLISVALTLVGADIALRLFSSVAPRSGQFIPEFDSYQRLNPRTATLSPNYRGLLNGRDFTNIPIATNRLGLRDDEYDFDALARSNPVLFLGDSYLFGWGVPREQRVSDIFSDLLSAQAIEAPVLNMTVPGIGTYQALDLFREFGLTLKPRLVILGFFVGNDFLDNRSVAMIDPGEHASPGNNAASLELIKTTEQAQVVSLRELLRTSPIFNLVKYGLWESSTFRHLFNRFEIRNDRIALYMDHAGNRPDGLYGPTLDALEEMVSLAQSADIPLLILIIPDHLQVLEPQLFADYDKSKPQRILSKHLATLKVPYIDLLPAFTAAADPQQLFFREDKHWSRSGNLLVSRELARVALGILADGKNQPAPGKTAVAE